MPTPLEPSAPSGLDQSELRQRLSLIQQATQGVSRSSKPIASNTTPKSLLDWYKDSTPQFNWTWPYQLKIIEALEKVTTGELKRLMVFLPPRVGKSSIITERYPVYRMERNPSLKVGVGCHSQKLAQKFGRRTKSMLASRGVQISRETRNQREWETQLGGVYRAFGAGSPPMGEGFNLIIIDDPIRDLLEAYSETYRDRVFDWYTSDVYTRREPDCAIVMVLHRWSVDDLPGRILNSEDKKNWTVISYPALAEEDDDELGRKQGEALCPERFSVSDILGAKRVMTAHDFSARYQQRCLPLEGAHFYKEWFASYREDGDSFLFPDGEIWTRDDMLTVVFLDPSLGKKGGDASGLLAIGYFPDGKMAVRESMAKRIPLPRLGLETKRMARVHGADYIAVEANGFQVEVARALQDEGWIVRELSPGSQDKLMRAQRSIVLAQQGAIYVPQVKPDWVDPFLNQLIGFTGLGDEADELVDCLAYAGKERDKFYDDSNDPGPCTFGGRNLMMHGGRMLPASQALGMVPYKMIGRGSVG